MTTNLLPSAVSVFAKGYGKHLGVSINGHRLLSQYLACSSHQNNDKLYTFGQFARVTSEKTAKEFQEEFVAPVSEKWGQDLVIKNGTENTNYWKIDLDALVEKIHLARITAEKSEETPENPHLKQMRYMLDHPEWSLIYNPRVFDVEMYMKSKGNKHREEKEFFLTLEYEDVEAWASFFNGLVADLKKRNKLD